VNRAKASHRFESGALDPASDVDVDALKKREHGEIDRATFLSGVLAASFISLEAVC
jgi:hypothetical protein